MKPSLEVLKLRAVVAGLEFQIAEQRMDFESLIRKGRDLMFLHEPIKLAQEMWLDSVNKLFPPDPEEKLLVKDVGVVSGACGVTSVPAASHRIVGNGYRLCDIDPRYFGYENSVVITSVGPDIFGYNNVCWRVR